MPDQSIQDLRIPSFKRGQSFYVFVNGKKITAYPGETIHALLTANGYYTVRKTLKKQQPRGVLCGMGVCYECLVTINGIPDQQACMILAKENMAIEVNMEIEVKQGEND